MCRHILGSRDEAEDALQQAFASAWSDVQRLQPPAPVALKSWLYAVARHRCLSLLRSRRVATVELQDVSSDVGLADEITQRADLRELLADLRKLPEEQRTALVLSEIAGMSHREIASVIGRKPSAVKALVFQARTTLGNWREARESACVDIRRKLCELRGSELRRAPLRHHLQGCPDCRAFRTEIQAQRRRLSIILPVLPSVGLKSGVLVAVGLGAASGGGAAGGGLALGGGSAMLVPLGSAAVATFTVVSVFGGLPLADNGLRMTPPADPSSPAVARQPVQLAGSLAASGAARPATPTAAADARTWSGSGARDVRWRPSRDSPARVTVERRPGPLPAR